MMMTVISHLASCPASFWLVIDLWMSFLRNHCIPPSTPQSSTPSPLAYLLPPLHLCPIRLLNLPHPSLPSQLILHLWQTLAAFANFILTFCLNICHKCFTQKDSNCCFNLLHENGEGTAVITLQKIQQCFSSSIIARGEPFSYCSDYL